MQRRKTDIWWYVWAALTALLAGCATSRQHGAELDGDALYASDITVADAMATAEEVLVRMRFAIEKADPERGVLRTRPLSGAQFLEFWRSDNVGAVQALEANLHTLRRSVEIQFRPDPNQVAIRCTVNVQRLSLPENKVASVSQAYRLHSRSSHNVQRLELEPWQREGLAWIDLGDDPLLAQRILQRIARAIQQPEKDETQ